MPTDFLTCGTHLLIVLKIKSNDLQTEMTDMVPPAEPPCNSDVITSCTDWSFYCRGRIFFDILVSLSSLVICCSCFVYDVIDHPIYLNRCICL